MNPGSLDALLAPCSWTGEHLATCPSTNDLAVERARAGRRNHIVSADHQTAGRGRSGRSWSAEAGENLLISAILAPPLPPEHVPRTVLYWAASLAEAFDLQVKWPNDLVTDDGDKVGGLLAQMELRGGDVDWVVLGLGLNVNQEHFADLPHATSLRRIRSRRQDRRQVLVEVIEALARVDVRDGRWLDTWRERSITLGRRVRYAGREGTATDVRDDGALLVDGEPVLAGDVDLVG